MSKKHHKTDLHHRIGYGENEQHLGKSKVIGNKEVPGP